MQARINTELNSSCDLPFVLVENSNHQDKGSDDYMQQNRWDFEIGTANKTVPLTLIVNQYLATLSDLVPVTHQLCDLINNIGIDDENENGEAISCQKGCANCCSYMVSISSAEAFYLQNHILSLPVKQRRQILHSFSRAARKIAANKFSGSIDNPISEEQSLKEISNWYQKLEIKCPFLEDNACSQYRARPLACREHLVTSSPKACLPSSAMLTNIVDLPVSSAETLMHISNRVEATLDEAVILPLAMIWCNSNSHRGEQKYPAAVLAEQLINAVSTKIPAMY